MTISAASKLERPHPPLARDPMGNLLAIPDGTAAWRICRETAGRPGEIKGPDKQPLRFPLDTTSDELWFLGGSIAILVVGLGLGAIQLSFHGGTTEKLRKGLGVACVLAGALGAWTWKLTPKQHLPWEHDEQVAFDRARGEHRGVMVDFSATWCGPCEEMELTFGDDEVFDAITTGFVPLKFDVSASSDEDLARRSRYGADTLPAVVFVAPDGTLLARVSKMTEPDAMLKIVTPATKKLKPGPTASNP